MALISFTKNHQDLSTDLGFQFKFFCDKCGNGHMTSFIRSNVGLAGSLLRGAGGLLGGFLGQAGSHSYEIQRAVGGKEHDAAFRQAVEEARPNFKQCSRCGDWVCPENCWNAERSLCETCAPNLDEERAAAQATAIKDQVWQKARSTDLVSDVDMTSKAVAYCPQCGAKAQGGKFCPECGAKFSQSTECPKCGTAIEGQSKFCPECGEKVRH
jgi:membrane protease subunit (stomatin/prohibitin family)